MVNAFSFCVFGSDKKYCFGMIKNIIQIQDLFPEFSVFIHCGNDVPKSFIVSYASYQNVKIITHDVTGGRLMTYRFFTIDYPNVDIMITRDADSRFEKRDVWCIREFLNSNYAAFTVRDHPYHLRVMMGGLSGFRKIQIPGFNSMYDEYKHTLTDIDMYESDQLFLEKCIYPYYKSSFIAYANTQIYDEQILSIVQPRETEYDFCGNVVLFTDNDEEYYEFKLHF